jgi:hypothetical protein
MANYYGQARTNYFAVKNAEAFRAELADLPVEIIEQKNPATGETLFGFMDSNSDGGGLDWMLYTEVEDENGEIVDTEMEIDWTAFLASHLADGHVAILMETGAEKYRYLQGWALAVNNKGETREINLSRDITNLAKELGSEITNAMY